jgi:hypothetical protein
VPRGGEGESAEEEVKAEAEQTEAPKEKDWREAKRDSVSCEGVGSGDSGSPSDELELEAGILAWFFQTEGERAGRRAEERNRGRTRGKQ